MVEAHCYGIGRGGAIVEQTQQLKQIEMLDVLTAKVFVSYSADEDLRSRNILHFNQFQLLRFCSTIAPPLNTSYMLYVIMAAMADTLLQCP